MVLNAVPPSASAVVARHHPHDAEDPLPPHQRRLRRRDDPHLRRRHRACVEPWALLPDGTDAFGAYLQRATERRRAGVVGYIFHIGDNKDDNGADQAYTMHARRQRDLAHPGRPDDLQQQTRSAPPRSTSTTVRVPLPALRQRLRHLGPAPVGRQRAGHQPHGQRHAIGDWNNPTAVLGHARLRAGRVRGDLRHPGAQPGLQQPGATRAAVHHPRPVRRTRTTRTAATTTSSSATPG